MARLVFEEAKQRLGYTDEDLLEPEHESSRSVWVSGLSPTNVEAVMSEVSKHGTILSVLSRLTLSSSQEAATCVQQLQGLELGARRVSLELDRSSLNIKQEEKSFLRNLANKVGSGDDEEELNTTDNSKEKNVVMELFDEVMKQKVSNLEPRGVSSQGEEAL